MDKYIPLTEARANLSEIVNAVMYRGDTYIISKSGKPAVAVIPVSEWETQSEKDALDFIEHAADTDRKPAPRVKPTYVEHDKDMARKAADTLKEIAADIDVGTFDWEEWKRYRDEGRH